MSTPSQTASAARRDVEGFPAAAIEPWWKEVWLRHQLSYDAQQAQQPSPEDELRHELLFCLLGGHGVSFELASSACEVIARLRPFGKGWTVPTLRSAVRKELSKAQFEPLRRDGSPRRYRFPKRKAEVVSAAAQWVRAQGSIEAGLASLASEGERREWLCGCPGVGFKTASWLLRNCGWARELAILDVHLLRAMRELGLVEGVSLPRDYVFVEEIFLRWALELGATPGALDLFLWDLQRVRPATVLPKLI